MKVNLKNRIFSALTAFFLASTLFIGLGFTAAAEEPASAADLTARGTLSADEEADIRERLEAEALKTGDATNVEASAEATDGGIAVPGDHVVTFVTANTTVTVPGQSPPYHSGDDGVLNFTTAPDTGYAVSPLSFTLPSGSTAGITKTGANAWRLSNVEEDITLTVNADPPYSGQTGSDGYAISSAAQLEQLASAVNGAATSPVYTDSYFTLTGDITLAGTWTPIGGGGTYTDGQPPGGNAFAGDFDGDGYTVSGLEISPKNNSTAGYGLFGCVSGGMLANLTVAGEISSSALDLYYVGGLVGYTSGIIWNCHNGVDITLDSTSGGAGSKTSMTGGLAGAVEGDGIYVRYSSNSGDITGRGRVGGIAGALYCDTAHGAVVDNCYNTGDIATVLSGATQSYAGGIVGYSAGYITNSYSYGIEISTVDGHYLGGLVGMLQYGSPQPALANVYSVAAFRPDANPDYDKWLFASVDRSYSTPIAHALWVDTYRWSGSPTSYDEFTQNRPGSSDPWGAWTQVGYFYNAAGGYDSRTGAVVYTGTNPPPIQVTSALDVLNTEVDGIAAGDQFSQDAAHNAGYPYLTWEAAGGVPWAPVSPPFPPPPETGVFLDGVNGDNANDGLSPQSPVATFQRAAEVLDAVPERATMYILDTVTVAGSETWMLPRSAQQNVMRSATFHTGPLVSVPSGADLTLENITMDGNATNVSGGGPIISVAGGSVDILHGAVLQNNRSPVGGAVSIDGGSGTLYDGIIQNNVSGLGGAVSVDGGGTFTLTRGDVKNNSASTFQSGFTRAFGGAFYVAAGATLAVNGGVINGNMAQTYKNSPNNALGGAIYAGGNVTLNNGDITNNYVDVGSTGGAEAHGGGIYIAPGGTVTVTGSTLGGNTERTAGATQNQGVYFGDGTLDFAPSADGYLNWSDEIYLADKNSIISVSAPLSRIVGTLNVRAVDASLDTVLAQGDNYTLANTDGQRIFYLNDDVYCVVIGTNNRAVLGDKVFLDVNGSSSGDGTKANPYNNIPAALAKADGERLIQFKGPFALTGSELDLSGGDYDGSAFRRDPGYSGVLFTVDSGATVVLSGVSVNGNLQLAPNATGTIVQVSGGTLTVGQDAALENNAATSTGGGVNATNASVTISGGSVSGNNIGTVYGQWGGGVFVSGAASAFTLSGGRISGNSANGGGGLYITGVIPAQASLSGGTIDHNYGNGSGGGLYLTGGATATISGTQINENTAATLGGGAYFYTSGGTVTVTMTGGAVDGNDSGTVDGGSGAGVYLSSGSVFNVSGGSVSKNYARSNGGGIYNSSSTLNVSGNAAFEDNISASYGGAIAHMSGTLAITGGTFTDNTADNGGGVYASSAVATLTGATFTGNRAIAVSSNTLGGAGGGLYSTSNIGATGGFDGITFSGNEAIGTNASAGTGQNNGSGGGMYWSYTSTTPTAGISGVTFGSNKARQGGGFYRAGSAALTLTNVGITGNEASANGGGAYIASGSVVTLGSGTVSGNTASGNGNGFYVAASNSLTLSPSGDDAITFGAGDDIYLPAQVTFNIAAALETGAPDGISLTFASPQVGNTVATTGSSDIANESWEYLFPTNAGVELGVSGSNITIVSTR
jgi:parallel beta-helix repeat protein